MAKRVVQDEKQGKNGKPIRKKRHGCRNCFITFAVILVVLTAGVYGVGTFFTHKYLDMSLWDCFGVLHDVTSANGKKIVTNAHGDGDYKAFDTALKDGLFLKSDVDFGVDKLLTLLVSEETNEPANRAANGESYLLQSARVLNAGFSTDAVFSELADLYVRENMNLARLDAYDPVKHDAEYVLHISDKMLAAAVNRSLDSVSGMVGSMDGVLSELGVQKVSEVAKLEQIVFGETNGVKTVKVTVSVDARKIAQNYLKKATGHSLSFLTKIFLPKRMYATAVLATDGGTLEHTVFLNNMNGKDMDRAYKLVQKITSLAGNELDFKSKIASVAETTVADVMQKINTIFPLNEAKNGRVDFDVFQTVIDVSNVNEKDGELLPEDEQLTASDLIETLAGVVASDADAAVKTEYAYKNQYFDPVENKVVYVKTPVRDWQLVDYEREFMDELANKYMLDLTMGTPETEDDVTFDELMRLFGLGGENTEARDLELMDLFAPSAPGESEDDTKLDDILASENKKVSVNSRMLGAILQAQIDTLIADGGSLGTYDPAIEYVYTYTASDAAGTHNLLEAAISVSVDAVTGEGGTVADLLKGLLGSRAVIVFRIDITPAEEENFAYMPGTVLYNGISAERTDTILKTVAFFADGFDKAALLEQVETPVRDAIAKMNDVVSITLCSSKIDTAATAENLPSAMELPDVFGAVKDMMFADDEAITADGIEQVLRDIRAGGKSDFEASYVNESDRMTTVESDGRLVPSYAASLRDVLDKYYVHDPDSYAKFDDLFGANGVTHTGNFAADKFDFNTLYYDGTPAEELHPLFTSPDLAALILEKMAESDSGLYDDLQGILGMHITENGVISLYLRMDTDSVVTDEKQRKMLPAEHVYVRAEIDANRVLYYDKATGELYGENGLPPAGYDSSAYADTPEDDPLFGYTPFFDTAIHVNYMEDETYAVMLRMIESLNGDGAARGLGMKARDVGAIVKEQLDTVTKALGGSIAYTDEGIRLVSVFDYIKKVRNLPDTYTENDVRKALQGLQPALTETSDGAPWPHNYSPSVLITNELYTSAEVHVTNVHPDTKQATLLLSDRSFGYGLVHGFSAEQNGYGYTTPPLLGNTEGFTLRQMNILCGTLGERQTFAESFGVSLTPEEKTYIEFTFAMDLATASSGDLQSVLPESVFVTVLFSYSANGYAAEYYRVNALDVYTQAALIDLAGIDEARITEQIDECATALESYDEADFFALTESDGMAEGGYGYIAFTVTLEKQ